MNFRAFLDRFTTGKFARALRNVSYLTAGQLATQFVAFLGMTIIARELGPDNYGLYVTVFTFVGAFDILNLKGTSRVLIREGSKNLESMPISLEKLIGIKHICAILSIIVTIVSVFFVDKYDDFLKFYIVAYSLIHISFVHIPVFNTIFLAAERMKWVALITLGKQLFYTVFAVIIVYQKVDILWLILLQLSAGFLALFVTMYLSRRVLKFKLFVWPKWEPELLKPSLVFSAMGVVSFLHTRIDLLMISFMGNSTEVGVYAIAFKIAKYMQMIRSQVSLAFFPMFVKRFEAGSVRLSLLLKVSLLLFSAVAAFAAIFSLVAEELIVFLFDEKFQASGPILSVLIYYIAFGFMNLPFTSAVVATGNEKSMLVIDSIAPVLNIGFNIILYYEFGLMGIAYSTLLTRGIMTTLGVFYYSYILKKQGRLQ